MSYQIARPSAMGTTWADIVVAAGQGASKILNDPYFAETACEVVRLSNVITGRAPGESCKRTSSSKSAALEKAPAWLRAYTFHKQHPWVLPTAGVGALALIFYAGYRTGQRRR